jgi:hypothetical protein
VLSATVEAVWGVPHLGWQREGGGEDDDAAARGGAAAVNWARGGGSDFLWRRSDCELNLPFFHRNAFDKASLNRLTFEATAELKLALNRFLEAGVHLGHTLAHGHLGGGGGGGGGGGSAGAGGLQEHGHAATTAEHAWGLTTQALERAMRYLSLNNAAQARGSLVKAQRHAHQLAAILNDALDHIGVKPSELCF